MFERTALPEGPRVISSRVPGARSVSIAAYVLAGSRLESAAEAGVAHFMEHLTFKGTAAYPSTRAISEAIEGAGGSFNAATDRESTVYWVRVPHREARLGMDVIGELIVRPTLSGDEIEGERSVIIEEIRGYQDDPAEYAQILFQSAMFGDGPLGREICGDEAGIRALPDETIRDFWRATYRPANTVVAVAGDLGHDEALDLASNAFGTGNGVVPGFAPAPALPAGERVLVGKRPTAQAQLVVGKARGVERGGPAAVPRVLVEREQDRLPDPPDRVRDEPHPTLGIEEARGPHEASMSFIGRSSRVSGFSMSPSVSSVTMPRRAASRGPPSTAGDVPDTPAISKVASGCTTATSRAARRNMPRFFCTSMRPMVPTRRPACGRRGPPKRAASTPL